MAAFLTRIYSSVKQVNLYTISVFIALLFLLISPLFVHSDWAMIRADYYLPIHTGLEIFSVGFALMIFAVSSERLQSSMTMRAAVLACAFFAVALFDLSHLLSFTGMPDYVTPSGPQKTIYFWLAARLTVAFALLFAVMPTANGAIKYRTYIYMLLLFIAVVLLFHAAVFFHVDWLPQMYLTSSGLTRTKIVAEYSVIAIHLCTIFVMYLTNTEQRAYFAPALYAALWCSIFSEVHFTLYLSMNDIFNALGHIFKICAYLFLYRALLHEVLAQPYAELIEREADISATLDAIPDLLLEVDDGERFCQVKNETKVPLYMPPEQFIGKTIAECLPADATKACHEAIQQARKEGRSYAHSYPLVINGATYWFQVVAAARKNIKAKCRFVLAVRDITKQTLADADQKINALAFYTREGIMITDANSHIIKVNPAFCIITGYTEAEVLGKTPSILSSGQHDAVFYQQMWQALQKEGVWQGEIYNKRKNGEIFPEQVIINALENDVNVVTHYIASFNDISKAKADQQYIHQLAFYDSLTKLPNRRLLLERIVQVQAHCQRSGEYAALFFIDLDHFKQLNDSLGHSYGDELLRQLGTRLQHCIRESDTLARPGGDEFILLANFNTTNKAKAAADAQELGNKLLQSINHSFALQRHHYQISASIGIALFNDNKKEIDELMSSADMAMYHSKEKGRNQLYFFEPGMQQALRHRQQLEQALKQAIAKQQLQLFYQPKVDANANLVSYEALIRWFHPELGMVSPGEFIPLAENSHLINEIGAWVLKTACLQIKHYQSLGQRIPIAVNVSERQLVQKDFVDIVTAIVNEIGIDASLLELEITESMLNDDLANTRDKLLALNKLGVTFSLDDFGTGYSSLIYLKNLPISLLKIDQSFVKEFLTQDTDYAIVKTILAMARALSLHVVAEGVERQDQFDALIALGCDLFQGYLFGKPSPPEQNQA